MHENRVKYLNTYAQFAPVMHREMIHGVAKAFKRGKVSFPEAEKVVLMLSSKNTALKRSGRPADAYMKLMSKAGEGELDRAIEPLLKKQPMTVNDRIVKAQIEEQLRKNRKYIRRLERELQIAGGERLVTVILYTIPEKKNAARGPKEEQLDKEDVQRYRKYLNKHWKGLHQFWKGQLTVKGGSDDYWGQLERTLVRRGDPGWRKLFRICLTDPSFKRREIAAPGYNEAIYILDQMRPDDGGDAVDPTETAKRAGGDKVTIDYKYCANFLDLSKDTFEEAIKKGNYTDSECWLNTLHDYYHDNLLSVDKKRCLITRERILELLGKTEETIKQGLTIQDMLPFFVTFKLKLRVYDKFYKKVFAYDPPVPNFNNKPMHCLIDGDHVYTLNHDIRSLEHKNMTNDDEKEELKLPVGSDYRLMKREPVQHRMISHVDDILRVLRELDDKEEETKEATFLIHQHDDLSELLWQLHERGHKPTVRYEAGNITSITMYFNNRMIRVKTQQLVKSEIDGLVHITDVNTYNRCDEAMAHFNNQIFRMDHKSYYNKEDMDVLNEYRTIANVGFMRSVRSAEGLVEIDMCKAYTKAFMRIRRVPVFNEFDVFRPYAGQPIEDMCLYIVEGSEGSPLFFNKTRNLVYGQFLRDFPDARIIAVKKPSFIRKVRYGDIARELYESLVSFDGEEDKHIKKQIAVCNFGLLEKHINRNLKSYVFETYQEAKFYQARYGGTINYIKQYEEKRSWVIPDHDLDYGLQAEMFREHPGERVEFVETGKVLYILNIHAQCDMTNGFRYIKELLLQHHNHEMHQAWRKLKAAGVEVLTVKTDAFTIRAADALKAQEVLDFASETANIDEMVESLTAYARALKKSPRDLMKPSRYIAKMQGQAILSTVGKWRISKTDPADIKLPYDNIQRKKVLEIPIAEPTTNQIPLTIAEEYDVDKICDIFEEKGRVVVRAKFAGSGKSHACKNMQKRGHKVLFVCPTNVLCQSIQEEDDGIEAVTANHFFGVGITEDSKTKRFDSSMYNVIVFDEIFLMDTRKLARIKKYMEANPDKIILATGDTRQLEPVEPMTNNHADTEAYTNSCVDLLFRDQLFLSKNKRLKSEEDREKLERFTEDIFDESIPPEVTVKKYFPIVHESETDFNIAYFNATCERVAEKTRRRMGKRDAYEVGESLVCRSYLKIKRQGGKPITLYKNYGYKVEAIEGDHVTITAGDESITLPIDTVRKNFIHNYCRTCHSFQGLSIDTPITIYDWKCKWATRKWIYTAVTRARQLDQVRFDGGRDEFADRADMVTSYLRRKVEAYREQDGKAGRDIEADTYVTAEWLEACCGKPCQNCGDCLYACFWRGKVESNITAQRINNNIGHQSDNIVPFCKWCNCAMGNRE